MLAMTGTAVGTGVAYAFAAMLARLMLRSRARSARVHSGPLLLLVVASAAVWIPAHRAAPVDRRRAAGGLTGPVWFQAQQPAVSP
jgi:hypothetical protein